MWKAKNKVTLQMKCFCATFFFFFIIPPTLQSGRVYPIPEEPRSDSCKLSKEETTWVLIPGGRVKEKVCLLEAGAHRYLGDTAGLENRPELRGDWRVKEWEGEDDVGDTLRGLLRSPLLSFHRSSSFSIDKRLFTLDSFWRDSCSAACSVDSCL